MTDNLSIWNDLGKTDPSMTKGFKRAGGFSGTSTKPVWIIKRMTERFGPAGVGWGVNKPDFETVHSQGGEVLVYCTVSVWHGECGNVLWGVGGDRAVAMRKDGTMFHDDEAFKKAFTDAVNNALKSLGMNADIHMGLFDDDKYVAEMEREFAAPVATITEDQRTELIGLLEAAGITLGGVAKKASENTGRTIDPDLSNLPASEFEPLMDAANAKIEAKKKENA